MNSVQEIPRPSGRAPGNVLGATLSGVPPIPRKGGPPRARRRRASEEAPHEQVIRTLWEDAVREGVAPALAARTPEGFEAIAAENVVLVLRKLIAINEVQASLGGTRSASENESLVAEVVERWGGQRWRDAVERGFRNDERIQRTYAQLVELVGDDGFTPDELAQLGPVFAHAQRWTFALLGVVALVTGHAQAAPAIVAHLLALLENDMTWAFATLRALLAGRAQPDPIELSFEEEDPEDDVLQREADAFEAEIDAEHGF